MSEIYFTIAGTNHWHGQEFIEPKMQVKLFKGKRSVLAERANLLP